MQVGTFSRQNMVPVSRCGSYRSDYRVALASYPFRYLLRDCIVLADDILHEGRPHGAYHVAPKMLSGKCLGVPSSTVAVGMVSERGHSVRSGHRPFWFKRVRILSLVQGNAAFLGFACAHHALPACLRPELTLSGRRYIVPWASQHPVTRGPCHSKLALTIQSG